MIRFLIVLIIGLVAFNTAVAAKTVGGSVPNGVVFLHMTLGERLSTLSTRSTPDTSFEELVDEVCTEYRRQKAARSLDASSLAWYLQKSGDDTYAALERDYEDHYIRLSFAEQQELEEKIAEMRTDMTFTARTGPPSERIYRSNIHTVPP